jgi:hypothetical protein
MIDVSTISKEADSGEEVSTGQRASKHAADITIYK